MTTKKDIIKIISETSRKLGFLERRIKDERLRPAHLEQLKRLASQVDAHAFEIEKFLDEKK